MVVGGDFTGVEDMIGWGTPTPGSKTTTGFAITINNGGREREGGPPADATQRDGGGPTPGHQVGGGAEGGMPAWGGTAGEACRPPATPHTTLNSLGHVPKLFRLLVATHSFIQLLVRFGHIGLSLWGTEWMELKLLGTTSLSLPTEHTEQQQTG